MAGIGKPRKPMPFGSGKWKVFVFCFFHYVLGYDFSVLKLYFEFHYLKEVFLINRKIFF
jgi:hypothetical protein